MLSSARIAPSWIRTAKVLPKSSSPKPKKCCSRSKCPVDDTGMYSVRPSTMPRPVALKISTNIGQELRVNRQDHKMNKDRETPPSQRPQAAVLVAQPDRRGKRASPILGSARPPANTSTLDWFTPL